MSLSFHRMMDDLLEPAIGSSPVVKSGYVDVLGERDANGPRPGQQVFRKKFLPPVYERFWRPMVSRYFVGLTGPRAKKERLMTMEMLEISSGDRVIDIGCGPGNYSRSLAIASGEGLVVGVDASEAMVVAAVKRGGSANLSYLRADACALPFRDGTFDVACSVGVIHMIDDPFAALDEMVRVLAPGGRLAILASCAAEGRPRRTLGGATIFSREDLTGALRERGLGDIEQQIIRRGQLVSARQPEGDANGR
jgi:SAM-dependent methyltransferase